MNASKKFQRLSRPAIPMIKLAAERGPDDPPVSVSGWSRLSRPAIPVIVLAAEPSFSSVELAFPRIDDKPKIENLAALVERLNELEALFNRPGVTIDAERSGIRDGKTVLVVSPNDPTNAIETCKRVADFLFAIVRPITGVTVRVFSADEPGKTIYELAV